MEKLNNPCNEPHGFIDEISIIDEAGVRQILDNRIPTGNHAIIFTTSKEDSKKEAAKLADLIKNHPVITKL